MVIVLTDIQFDQILKTLENELTSAQALLAVLEAEHQVLRYPTPESLIQVIASKKQTIEQYERISQARDKQLESFGLSPGRQGIESALSLFGEHLTQSKLYRIWGLVRQTAAKCQRQNAVNAGIVQLAGQHVERALEILHVGYNSAPVYGPNGGTCSRIRSHSLALA